MAEVDFLVIGAGIAGLRAAVGLAQTAKVLVVTKEALAESNTAYAQGGIAVAMGGQEDIALHLEDTVSAGDGLVDREAAAVLVEEGPWRVEELLAWGTEFDRDDGRLMRTREGAHSRSRILHAHGDATGREIALSLLRHARSLANIELREWTTTVDLILEQGRIAGVTLLDAGGALCEVRAGATLLASGGAGQVYSETTNPPVATGDGIAMAWRAGAQLMDMEFMQFHPTAFAHPGAPRFLMSEALRGEGALLVNAQGQRFMQRYDPRLELAPRDVVARAIAREAAGGNVYLDMRAIAARMDLKARFPGISAFLAQYGLTLADNLIPVLPAAHYLMGGIRTDTYARTSLPGLYAAGECACTGVHGANRLASNSLLEGLVFGARAAEAMIADPFVAPSSLAQNEPPSAARASAESFNSRNLEGWIAQLRSLMWRDAGLLRSGEGLLRARTQLAALRSTMPAGYARREIEGRNLHAIADVTVQAAVAREESRGAHLRTDFPARSPVARHSLIRARELSWIDIERN